MRAACFGVAEVVGAVAETGGGSVGTGAEVGGGDAAAGDGSGVEKMGEVAHLRDSFLRRSIISAIVDMILSND
ncbi:hypothetical protein Hdeb2414_s0022g00615821 [Helianthus debilis subsp. tardiflorus]